MNKEKEETINFIKRKIEEKEKIINIEKKEMNFSGYKYEVLESEIKCLKSILELISSEKEVNNNILKDIKKVQRMLENIDCTNYLNRFPNQIQINKVYNALDDIIKKYKGE